MYHRFATDVAVEAADVREGDVVHAATCSRCGDVQRVLSVREGGNYGVARTVEVGCLCGTAGSIGLHAGHVLSYSGTLAVIG